MAILDIREKLRNLVDHLRSLGAMKAKMTDAQRAKFAALLKRTLARRTVLTRRCGPLARLYKGPITDTERRGTTILPMPLLARFTLDGGPLGDTFAQLGNNMANGVKLFHLGETNNGQNYGFNGSLTRYHTSFDKNGDLPNGWWFVCHGFDVTIEALAGEVVPADLRILGDGRARWLENGGSMGIPLPELRRMPPSYRVDQTKADAIPASVYFRGPSFRTRTPIFRIRGGKGETREMRIEWPDTTATLSQKYMVTVEAIGLMGVVPTVG